MTESHNPMAAEKKPKNRVMLVLTMTCILVIVLAGYLSVSYRNVVARNQELMIEVSDIRGQANAIKATVEDFRQQSKDVLAQNSQGILVLSQHEQQLENQLKTLTAAQGASDTHWRLAEVDYLLGMAERQLQIEHNKKSAVTLLETAVEELAKQSDARFLPLRTALTNDLQSIKGLPEINIVQLALDVNAMMKVADQLPLLSDSLLKPSADKQSQNAAAPTGDWKQRLEQSTHEFISLIKVRETQEVSNVFLTSDQEKLVRLMLQSKLNSLQLLVLHEEFAALPAMSLEIQAIISKYYLMDAAAVKGIQESLQKFVNMDFRVTWPDLHNSIQALNATRDAFAKAPS